MDMNGMSFSRPVGLQSVGRIERWDQLSIITQEEPLTPADTKAGEPEGNQRQHYDAFYIRTPGKPDSEEVELANTKRMFDIFLIELPSKVNYLEERMQDVEKVVVDKVPESLGKQWDFSTDEMGSVVVTSSELSENEKDKIAVAISRIGINHEFSSIRDLMVEYIEIRRGGDLFARDIGKYDLTQENFSDIVYFKEFVVNSKKLGLLGATESFCAQVEARAEVVFNKYTEVYECKDGIYKEVDVYV